jgi:predicted dehydrogenase
MTKPIRVGVAGVGYLGRIHARVYASMPNVQLVGVADVNNLAASEVATQHGCTAYGDPRELVGKVDAVSIVVPTSLHGEVARPFLDAGVHMLMEKPIAPTLEEAQAIVEHAERQGVVFQVGHLERFNAGIMALSDRCHDPRFIEVHRLGPFVERATDVDVVTDLMIHDLDIVLSLVKSPLRSIAASGVAIITDHVDIANARLEFENGVVANVTASRVSAKKYRRIRVFGERRYYGLDYMNQTLEIAHAEPVEGGGWPKIVTEIADVQPRPPLDTELEYFIRCVRTGETPLVTGRVGIEALRVAMAVKEQIAKCQQ